MMIDNDEMYKIFRDILILFFLSFVYAWCVDLMLLKTIKGGGEYISKKKEIKKRG